MRRIAMLIVFGALICGGWLYSQEASPPKQTEKPATEEQKISPELKAKIDDWIKKLHDPNPSVRANAIWKLWIIVKKQEAARIKVLPKVRSLLKDADPTVRAEAVYALGVLKDRYAVQTLLELTNDKDILVRQAAICACGKVADHSQTHFLIKFLEDKEPKIQAAAIKALGELKDKSAGEYLIPFLDDTRRVMFDEGPFSHQKSPLNSLARFSLWEISGQWFEGPMDEVKKQWQKWYADYKKRIKESLTKISGNIPELIKRLGDDNWEIRNEATKALLRMGDQCESAVKEALNNPDAEVRFRAQMILRRLEWKRLLPAEAQAEYPDLIKRLTSLNPEEKLMALTKLFMRYEDKVVPLFKKFLRDNDPTIRAIAAGVLGKAKQFDILSDLIQLLKDSEEDVRLAAMQGVVQIGKKEVIPKVMGLLKEKETGPRAAAAYVLGGLGDIKVSSELVKLLSDQSPKVRYRAVEALGKLGEKSLIFQIIPILNDTDGRVRYHAVQTLLKLHAKKAVPFILKLLGDKTRVEFREPFGMVLSPPSLQRVAIAALEKLTGESFRGTMNEQTAKWNSWYESHKHEFETNEK